MPKSNNTILIYSPSALPSLPSACSCKASSISAAGTSEHEQKNKAGWWAHEKGHKSINNSKMYQASRDIQKECFTLCHSLGAQGKSTIHYLPCCCSLNCREKGTTGNLWRGTICSQWLQKGRTLNISEDFFLSWKRFPSDKRYLVQALPQQGAISLTLINTN